MKTEILTNLQKLIIGLNKDKGDTMEKLKTIYWKEIKEADKNIEIIQLIRNANNVYMTEIPLSRWRTKEMLINYFKQIANAIEEFNDNECNNQQYNPGQKRVIKAVKELKDSVKGDHLLLDSIANRINENLTENFQLTNTKIAKILKSLGLTTEKKTNNKSYLRYDLEIINNFQAI